VKDKARILLVDDDEDFVEATKLVLESKPYEVITARDGDEGLAKAKSERPDLIILDIIMPVKDYNSLMEIEIDRKKLIELSKKENVVGLHCFTIEKGRIQLK